MTFLLLTLAMAASPSIKVTPAFCDEPCTIEVLIQTPSTPKGTEVCVMVENGKSRKTCWPHDGSKRVRTTIKGFPAGEYEVWATVGGASSAHRPVVVRPSPLNGG